MTGALRRILLVEDDPVDTELTLGLLREGLSESAVMHVDTIGAALDVIAAGDVDAILLDLRLPDGTGTDALRRVQAASAAPVVVLTSVVDDVLAIELVRAGADDYLVKGRLGPESLARVLRFAAQRHARGAPVSCLAATDLPVVALLGGHALLLDGLAGALTASGSYAVLGPCATVDALESARGRRLDVAVVDVARLSGGPSLPLAHLRLRLAGTRILLLADVPDRWLHAILDDGYADGLIEHTRARRHRSCRPSGASSTTRWCCRRAGARSASVKPPVIPWRRSPTASARCSRSSPRAGPTRRSPVSCTSRSTP